MALKIPPDANVITDQRLTVIRAISTLYDRLVYSRGGLVSQVKETMLAKHAEFAESEFAVAQLRTQPGRASIDASAAWKLFDAKGISLRTFLNCCTVRMADAKKHLSETEIEKVADRPENPEPSLVTEFRSAIDAGMDPKVLQKSIQQGMTAYLSALSTVIA